MLVIRDKKSAFLFCAKRSYTHEKNSKNFFQKNLKKVLTNLNCSAIIVTVQHAGVAQWQSS